MERRVRESLASLCQPELGSFPLSSVEPYLRLTRPKPSTVAHHGSGTQMPEAPSSQAVDQSDGILLAPFTSHEVG
jgi:hypothetical protein